MNNIQIQGDARVGKRKWQLPLGHARTDHPLQGTCQFLSTNYIIRMQS